MSRLWLVKTTPQHWLVDYDMHSSGKACVGWWILRQKDERSAPYFPHQQAFRAVRSGWVLEPLAFLHEPDREKHWGSLLQIFWIPLSSAYQIGCAAKGVAGYSSPFHCCSDMSWGPGTELEFRWGSQIVHRMVAEANSCDIQERDNKSASAHEWNWRTCRRMTWP